MKKTVKIDFYLIAILLISAFMYCFGIWNDDAVNPYYTAAITSMVQNFHNFFYAAFDPAGFITVDKPPVAFWFQAISAKLLGVHGYSVILPQALFGIGSVFIIYLLVKPHFGRWSARLSALFMALTPIVVAVTRTNNVDAVLVFFLLIGSYFLFKAVGSGRFYWLILAFIMIGIGFNVKMLQAFMVLPAFLFFYFIASKNSWRKKINQLIVSLLIMFIFAMTWALVVDNTNTNSRPYVGSSQKNSILDLAFGYNGVERLFGQQTGIGNNKPGGQTVVDGAPGNTKNNTYNNNNQQSPQPKNDAIIKANRKQQNSHTPPAKPRGNGKHGKGSKMMSQTGMFGTGEKGPLRLLQRALGDQISWFLPLAIFGSLAIFSIYRKQSNRLYQLTTEQKAVLFWIAWLIPVAAFFSIAGFFHHYYLIMLAPPIAVLAGTGIPNLFKLYKRQHDSKRYLLPSALILTGALQAFFVAKYSIFSASFIGTASLLISCALMYWQKHSLNFSRKLIAIGFIILLIAPSYWALTPLFYGGNSSLPEAGPQLRTSSGGGFSDATVDEGLIRYLNKNTANETYLFGTTDATTAGPYIIKTKKAVMALGGFNGTDPTLTTAQLKKLIKAGKISYFYIPANSKAGNSAVIKWIQKNGTKISHSDYSSEKTNDISSINTQINHPENDPAGINGTGTGTLYHLN